MKDQREDQSPVLLNVKRDDNAPWEFISAESEWMKFQVDAKNEKTYSVDVISKERNAVLGKVAWYAPWRSYAFYSRDYMVLDQKCLTALAMFIKELDEIRKHNIQWRKKNSIQ